MADFPGVFSGRAASRLASLVTRSYLAGIIRRNGEESRAPHSAIMPIIDFARDPFINKAVRAFNASGFDAKVGDDRGEAGRKGKLSRFIGFADINFSLVVQFNFECENARGRTSIDRYHGNMKFFNFGKVASTVVWRTSYQLLQTVQLQEKFLFFIIIFIEN